MTSLFRRASSQPAVHSRFVSMASPHLSSYTLSRFNAELGSRRITAGCCIMTRDAYAKHPARTHLLGYGPTPAHPQGAQWIIGLPDGKRVIDQARGDPWLLWKMLGLSTTTTPLEDAVLCVINPVAVWNLREATKDTPGANEEFVPTGYTSGGIREMVMNQVPLSVAMVASDGDFFVQKYVTAVDIDDPDRMVRSIEVAQLAQKQVTSTIDVDHI